MALFSRWLSLGPRISKRDGTLVATTGWRFRLLSLGTVLRRVVVDVEKKVVQVRSRYVWLFARTKTIPFRQIEAVTYGYEDLSPGADFSFAHDGLDLFTVGLRLYDDRDIPLFRFFGDGEFTNEGIYPDWCYWRDYLFDLSGTQQKESRLFVDLLSKMIGVSVEPPRR